MTSNRKQQSPASPVPFIPTPVPTSQRQPLRFMVASMFRISCIHHHFLSTNIQLLHQFPRAAVIEWHKFGCLNIRNLLSHTLKARSLRCKYQQRWFLLMAVRENLFHASSSLWWFAGSLWCSLACRCITPISAVIFTCHSLCVFTSLLSVHVCFCFQFPLLIRTLSYWIRTQINDLIFT